MKDGSSCGSWWCPVTWVAQVLLVVGGLNWALVGLWDWNLVSWAVGAWPTVEMVVYGLVGLSAVWMAGKLVVKCNCK